MKPAWTEVRRQAKTRDLSRKFVSSGTLYTELWETTEIELLRLEMDTPEAEPKSMAVDDFGQLDWGGFL